MSERKKKHEAFKPVRRGRIARKLMAEGMKLEDVADMWKVHPMTVKFYIMRSKYYRRMSRRSF